MAATIKIPIRRYEVYDNCDDLPLYNFIEVLTSGKTDKLTKLGNPPQEALQSAWDKISEEYAELQNSTTAQHLLKIQIDIEYMRNQLRITQKILDEIARSGYSEELAELLSELGYFIMFTGDTNAFLVNIVNQSKAIQTELQDKLDEYEGLQKKGETETTKTGYYELLADMGILDVKNTSVTQFIGAYNLYKKKNEPGQVQQYN